MPIPLGYRSYTGLVEINFQGRKGRADLKVWAAEFKRGRKSLGDDKRSGRPNTATTDETIAKVHQMGLDNRRIKVREIAEVMIMSKKRAALRG
ncbi:HTH_48 domain-containing protein [Trichonephila clavipes]|nr:HTH_48 domain-containing protein [Trichonephila clavipes]